MQRIPLPLVHIVIEAYDEKRGPLEARQLIARYVSLLPGGVFEAALWSHLMESKQHSLLLRLADDGALLAQSLSRFLQSKPSLEKHVVHAWHALQCEQYPLASASFFQQASASTAQIKQRKTMGSLAFLSFRCINDDDDDDTMVSESQLLDEMRVVRAAELVGLTHHVTRDNVVAFVLKQGKSNHNETPLYQKIAAGLQCGQHNPQHVQKLLNFAFEQDAWLTRVNLSGMGVNNALLEWVSSTVLYKLFHSIPATLRPDLDQFVDYIKNAENRKQTLPENPDAYLVHIYDLVSMD